MKTNYFRAMKDVAERLNKHEVGWFFYGSGNLGLQGVSIDIHNLNVCLKKGDLKKVKEIFSDKDYLPVRPLDVESKEIGNRCFAYVRNIEVEFASGEVYRGFFEGEGILVKKILGEEFRLNSLENELKAYELIGKEDKVEKLKSFLGD